jgi:hypothetical protein
VDSIEETLATAERAWRAHGVPRADRVALAADLRLDLESAAADGVGPAQLLGEDVPGFARRLAEEAGIRREPPELGRLLGTALVGGALGTTAGLGALLLLYRLLGSSPSEPTPARLFSTVPLGGTCRAAPPTRIEVYQ